ncbi:MAG: mechanosensitive ion channel domain-containing protein [Myxococcota bacterium]
MNDPAGLAEYIREWTHWPLLELLVRALLLLVVAALVDRLLVGAIRRAWALEIDRRRRLAWSIPLVRLLLVVVVLFGAFAPMHEDNPVSALLLGLLLGGAATTWGLDHLRDLAGGIRLALTRPFQLDDEIATERTEGRVVAIGLTRVRVVTAAGELEEVPTRAISRRSLRTPRKGRHALATAVHLHLPEHVGPEEALIALRDHAYLSAYVDAAAPVSVELLRAHEARVVATPVHPDAVSAMRSDLVARAARISPGG